MLTGDHNLVNIEASINFRVPDREADMVKFLLHKDFIDAFVARAAESILAEWIAGRKVNDMVRNGKTELPLFLAKHLQDRLDPYDLGIQIEYASITQLVPPDEVKAAFDRLNNAQNTIETQVNQAKQKANDKTKDAEAEIGRINDQTKSYVVVQHRPPTRKRTISSSGWLLIGRCIAQRSQLPQRSLARRDDAGGYRSHEGRRPPRLAR